MASYTGKIILCCYFSFSLLKSFRTVATVSSITIVITFDEDIGEDSRKNTA